MYVVLLLAVIFSMIFGIFRPALALVAGFGGIIYVVVTLTFLISGKIESKPTEVAIEMIENDGFPEARHLKVTGGHILFREAEVHVSGGEEEDRYVIAPVVSASLRDEWRSSIASDSQFDAAGVRLMVRFNWEQMGRLWPAAKTQVEEGKPPELAAVQMDLLGDSRRGTELVSPPREFRERTTNFDWGHARLLEFEQHYFSPALIAKNLAIAACLILVAFAAIYLRFPDRQVIVGPAGTSLRTKPKQITDDKAHTIPVTLEILSGPPGAMEVQITGVSPALREKRALLQVEAEVHSLEFYTVIGMEDAIKAREIVFSKGVTLSEKTEPISVSLRELKMYAFRGKKIEIRLYATISINDALVTETLIDVESIKPEALIPSLVTAVQTPYDPRPGRFWTLKTDYAEITRLPISNEARRHREVRLNELFSGRSTVDLEEVTVRVVARNTERLFVTYGGRVYRSTHEKRRPMRQAIIHETTIPRLAGGKRIESYVDGVLSFKQLFSAHYPCVTIAGSYGIGFELEVHLTHPLGHDVVSRPVSLNKWQQSSEEFEFNDFLV